MRKLLLGIALAFFSIIGYSQENYVEPRNIVVELRSLNNYCSGVIVAEGLIATAAHCEIPNVVNVILPDGTVLPGVIVESNTDQDLALVGASVHCPCIPLATSLNDPGNASLAVGYPFYPYIGHILWSWGQLQGVDKEGGILSQARIDKGMSGGGLFQRNNDHWELVGILEAYLGDTGLLSRSVPLDTLKEMLHHHGQ